jgi:hypothetical protein
MDRTGNVATVALFLATCLAWLGLEGWLVATSRPTISARIRAMYFADPDTGAFATLVTGLLLGHFFFSQRGRD